ncbi:MAG: hypothetical protein OXC82_01375 [Rhodobacteraceae bacterium]|nr:hypothetical protein [Paracoccaceae bacterium]
MDDLRNRTTMELLALHMDIMEDLRQSDVIRSTNTPTGDLAKFIFFRPFHGNKHQIHRKALMLETSFGNRYQIKGHRLHRQNTSRQPSIIHEFSSFEILAAVLFGEKFDVECAILIPKEVVQKRSKFVGHTNGFRFMLTDDVQD